MDETKQPGIMFRRIYLTKLQFSVRPDHPKEFKYALNLNFQKEIQELPDGGKRLLLTLSADPMFGVEPKPFDMQVEVVGVFEAPPQSNLPIEQFADIQAPAQLVPYLRELISSITARSPIPMLLLPPINVHALLTTKKIAPVEPETSSNG